MQNQPVIGECVPLSFEMSLAASIGITFKLEIKYLHLVVQNVS